MKVVFLAYRDWAIKIFEYIKLNPKITHIVHLSHDEDLLLLDLSEFDVLFTVGWSAELPDKVADNILSIGLHCAELDRYSYGTPIQLQIIDGVNFTKHRVFKFEAKKKSNRAHTHNRLYSHEVTLDLSGGINQIFMQLTATGITLFNLFINDYPNINWMEWPEEEIVRLRRSEEDSRVSIKDLRTMTTVQLYNIFRSLEDPYPNAYIEDEYGKLYINKVLYVKK
jgi:hypothetical protein